MYTDTYVQLGKHIELLKHNTVRSSKKKKKRGGVAKGQLYNLKDHQERNEKEEEERTNLRIRVF